MRILLLAAIAVGLSAQPAAAEWQTLRCAFYGANEIRTRAGTPLGSISLPHPFFEDFSMKTNGRELADVSIARWAADALLGIDRTCRADSSSISCLSALGDVLFLDTKSYLGTAAILGGSGYDEPVTVSFFRCST